MKAIGRITVEGMPVSLTPNASESLAALSSTIGLGRLIPEGLNGGSGDGSDGGNDGATSSTRIVCDGSSGGSRITGASATNLRSVRNTTASNPAQTVAVFAGGASRRSNRSWIEFATPLSKLFISLH